MNRRPFETDSALSSPLNDEEVLAVGQDARVAGLGRDHDGSQMGLGVRPPVPYEEIAPPFRRNHISSEQAGREVRKQRLQRVAGEPERCPIGA